MACELLKGLARFFLHGIPQTDGQVAQESADADALDG